MNQWESIKPLQFCKGKGFYKSGGKLDDYR